MTLAEEKLKNSLNLAEASINVLKYVACLSHFLPRSLSIGSMIRATDYCMPLLTQQLMNTYHLNYYFSIAYHYSYGYLINEVYYTYISLGKASQTISSDQWLALRSEMNT